MRAYDVSDELGEVPVLRHAEIWILCWTSGSNTGASLFNRIFG